MKENDSHKDVDTGIDSITKQVSAKFQECKQAFSNYLNEKVNRLSEGHKKISLVMFGFIMVAICTSLIIRSVNDNGFIKIDRITLPKDIYPNPHYKKGVEVILRLKKALDSLRKSPNEIAVYDSLMNARPGLMDSLGLLIRKYNSNYSH